MQEIYLRRNPSLYTSEERQQLHDSVGALSYKFHLANLSLEQLWALSHAKRHGLSSALQNVTEDLEVSDDELLLISFVFEGFLFQARAFLDFFMLFVCLLLKTGHRRYMSKKKFLKALKRVQQDPFAMKAQQVRVYFDTKVFGSSDWEGLNPNNWGTLLQSVRDKVAHLDRLRPSYDSEEILIGETRFDWPTLRGITYDRFCQYMQNGMFALVTDLSPILYELEWKSGPYKPDLWQ